MVVYLLQELKACGVGTTKDFKANGCRTGVRRIQK